MVVEDYLRPAAIRAGVLEVKDDKVYIDSEPVKRFGFHTFRHSLTSWLMANGENPQIVWEAVAPSLATTPASWCPKTVSKPYLASSVQL